jgi:hypothetical protein
VAALRFYALLQLELGDKERHPKFVTESLKRCLLLRVDRHCVSGRAVFVVTKFTEIILRFYPFSCKNCVSGFWNGPTCTQVICHIHTCMGDRSSCYFCACKIGDAKKIYVILETSDATASISIMRIYRCDQHRKSASLLFEMIFSIFE